MGHPTFQRSSYPTAKQSSPFLVSFYLFILPSFFFFSCLFSSFSFPRPSFIQEQYEASHRGPIRAQVNTLPFFWTLGNSSNPLYICKTILNLNASENHDAHSAIYYAPPPEKILQTTKHTCKNLTMHPTVQLNAMRDNATSERQKHQAEQARCFSCRETLRSVCL